ncbi:restriction endonuclease subunit S [Sulfitobacter sp.]|uniref:restriction endonuclease subunit S n=1 Tax=Sulfitobacter sp. TaxID=1903071 RepID=UPI004057D748
MSELPQGWVATTLGDLGRWSSGGTPSKRKPEYYGGDIPWVRTGDLRDNEIHDVEGRISPEGLANSSAKEFPSGTLLVAMYGATIGRTGMLCIPATTNQACAALLPDPVTEDMMPFLWWFFRHKVEDFRAVGQGGAQPNISQTVIKASAIDLPPLTEQRRIVTKLDRLSARSAAARDHLARTTKLATRAKQAILSAAVSGELTRTWRESRPDLDPWRHCTLGEVASGFNYGSAAKSAKEGDVPVLRMGNIQDGKLDWSDLVFTSDVAEISKYELHSGDVLFNRTNSPALVGKTTVYRGERPAIFAGYLIRVVCGTEVLPDFVNACLNSGIGRDYCWQVKTDGVSQSNINAQKLKAFPISLPSVEEQREIIRRVATAFTRIENLTEEATRAAHLLDRLDERLLAKAFRGELVPQDPDDEAAEALLARILEARAAARQAKRGRRKEADA